MTGQRLEEPSTDACTVEEEDGGARVIVVVLYSGRWLDDVLGSKATRGHTGTPASVLEVRQCWAHRCSSGVCGEAEAVPSKE
jgi:hypothetical protein